VAAVLLLAAVVARAELARPGATVEGALLAAGVGAAFPLAAGLAGGVVRVRLMFASVGLAWSSATWWDPLLLLHQGLLLAALLAFPTGTRGVIRWALTACALPITAQWLGQLGSAAAFLAVALVSAPRLRRAQRAGAFPFGAGLLLAGVLGASWVTSRLARDDFSPVVWLHVYEASLVVVAVSYARASRAHRRAESALSQQLLGGEQAAGVQALSQVLANALGDPSLRILTFDPAAPVDASGAELHTVRPGPPSGAVPGPLLVTDGDRVVAEIQHHADALDDPATAQAVVEAVRLVARNERRRAELDDRVAELAAARSRVTEASAREHAQMTAVFGSEVIDPLRCLNARLLDESRTASDPAVAEEIVIATSLIERSVRAIESLLAGLPPAPLGHGQLRGALETLARGRVVPVTLDLDPNARAPEPVEAALYYVAAEALANVDKHARATRASLQLRAVGPCLELRVADDGVGGADADGSGLRGLADRLAGVGGRLEVVSPSRGGTRVTATVASVDLPPRLQHEGRVGRIREGEDVT
jgi:hypothetical protein